MKNVEKIKLVLSKEQFARLLDLQSKFANACDEVALVMMKARSWHRVTLHHLAYKRVREKFPSLGSQMTCNAIHTVSRVSKELFQDKASHLSVAVKNGSSIPLLKFSKRTPVFFDKHTITLKKNSLSIFTLEGRMSVKINLSDSLELKLSSEKLKELSLMCHEDAFYLRFVFSSDFADSIPIKSSVQVVKKYPSRLLGS